MPETLRRKRATRAAAPALPGHVRPLDPADTLLPVHRIAAEIGGKRPAPNSVWRWTHGVHGQKDRGRGVTLPAVLIRGCWHTSRATYLSWLQARSEQRMATSVVADGDGGLE